MKNKRLARLVLYFVTSFVVFAFIIGVVFSTLFSRHNVEVHKAELERQSVSVAGIFSEMLETSFGGNMSMGRRMGMGGGGMGGMGSMGIMLNTFNTHLQLIEEIVQCSVWIVDQNLRQVVFGHRHMQIRMNSQDLPANAEQVILDALDGRVSTVEIFSDFLEIPSITAAAPIILNNGEIIGAILLHSYVSNVETVTVGGLSLLVYSMTASIFVSTLMATLLATRFTNRESTKLDKLRRDFVANISHELRTPITVIRGSLEALRDRVVTEPVKVETLHNQMLTETVHLERLVSDLLDLARLQNTDFVIEMQPTDLKSIAEDAVHSMRGVADSKGVHIDFVCDADSFSVLGDYGRLRQMLVIILDNAIKFSDTGKTVDIALAKHGKTAAITVQDEGCGIDQGDLPHIFERFYKQPNQQNRMGTGLGLPIAKQIADRHNISVDVKSLQGSGTKVVLIFKNSQTFKNL
ncbi:MAG: HAMP domain-containing histidine kinase [Defluviitaleaceae bacterium]|nr:HAMP domain-containing histidine kinase [Defluviitaleaceae bacterium]